MFKVHPELPGIIVDWFVTTLIKTPGHAAADTVASAFLSYNVLRYSNPVAFFRGGKRCAVIVVTILLLLACA